jgi:hypothetical protein
LNLLEELESLGAQIDSAGDLVTLKTIFYRLDEIVQQNPSDFEIQLGASDLKQRLLDRGNRLRKASSEVAEPVPAPPSVRSRTNWKPWVAAAVALLVLIGGGSLLAKRRKARLTAAAVPLEIVTVPPGAAVSINGEVQCTSNCRLSLPAGNYQVITSLDGYETAESDVVLAAGKPASLIFPLAVHAKLRILSDLDHGSVELDGESRTDLVEGQFVLDRVRPGTHLLKITGNNNEVSLPFEVAAGKAPSLTGAPILRNLITLSITSLGNHARAYGNGTPMKLAVNGQPAEDAGPAGEDLINFQSGLNEIRIGEGKDQRIIKEIFTAEPMLTVFLKSEKSESNLGTLIVSTGEDEVRVLLNGKEYPRKTKGGQIRIQTIGKLNVRVAKPGFDDLPPVSTDIRKGEATRIEFKLHPTPTFSILQVFGAMPGTEVVIDQNIAGVIGSDGSFAGNAISPGDHVIELRRERFVAKRLQRNFQAGQTVTISGADALLIAERLPPPPIDRKVEIPVKETTAPLPPMPGTIADFLDPSQWHEGNGEYVHSGAAFLPYKMTPNGIFTFTVQLLKGGSLFKGGKVRWRLMYTDNRNYAEFEIDNNNFVSRVIQNGKTFERTKTRIRETERPKQFTILIDVSDEHIVHKLRQAGGWAPLDAWSEPGKRFSEGKFGFQVQGNDEIGLSDFKFQPR